jgi:hypothetical protein
MNDNSVYSAITDRISISDGNSQIKGDVGHIGEVWDAYRGDCYIC